MVVDLSNMFVHECCRWLTTRTWVSLPTFLVSLFLCWWSLTIMWWQIPNTKAIESRYVRFSLGKNSYVYLPLAQLYMIDIEFWCGETFIITEHGLVCDCFYNYWAWTCMSFLPLLNIINVLEYGFLWYVMTIKSFIV